MAPPRTTQSQLAKPSDEALRCIPTPTTQELYNTYRKIDEWNQLQLQSHTESQGHLHPPTESQAPTSPQSPSCASTTHSINEGFGEVGISDEEKPKKKRKAIRSRPLTPRSRAKAAFMRKIGACGDCKSRRVQCGHFDNTLFEQAYQAEKLRSIPAATDSMRCQPTVSHSSVSDPAPNHLIHTGSWHTHSLPGNALGNDDVKDEIDSLLNLAKETPSADTTGLSAPLGIPEPAEPALEFGSSIFQTSPIPQIFQNGVSGNAVSQDLPPQGAVPVGRAVDGSLWECRHGDESAPSLWPLYEVCNERFSSLPELKRHFEENHATLSADYPMWKCQNVSRDGGTKRCDFLWVDGRDTCSQCGGPLRWEVWRYGTISKTPSLTSGPSHRVMSQDGSFMSGYGASQNAFLGGNSNFANFNARWPGRHLGPPYTTSHYSYHTHSTSSMCKDANSRRWPQAPARLDCGKSRTCAPITPFLVVTGVSLFLIMWETHLWQVMAWLVAKSARTVPPSTERSDVLWGSLFCVLGEVLMWMFKRIKFRPGHGHGEPVRPFALNISWRHALRPMHFGV